MVRLQEDERNRIRELIVAGLSTTEIRETIKREFGTDVSRENVDSNYRKKAKPDTGFNIEGEDWFKRSEKLKRVEENMLDLVDIGYQKLKEYAENTTIDNPKDAMAITQAIKQAQSIWDRLVVPTRSKEKAKDLEKEILG
jgi:hypothetical protein